MKVKPEIAALVLSFPWVVGVAMAVMTVLLLSVLGIILVTDAIVYAVVAALFGVAQ
jgi:hypothetical protein